MRPILLALMVGLAGCADKPEPLTTPPPQDEVKACTLDYRPVCALKDGVRKTYGNACAAEAVDAEVVSEGECPG